MVEDELEDDDFPFPVVFKKWTEEETEKLIERMKTLKPEKHFLMVHGWKNVQKYLGSQIGQMEVRKMGIQKGPTRKGRGCKTLYYIPYEVLVHRLLKNQRKIKVLKESVDIIRTRLIKDGKMKEYLEKELYGR